MLTFFLLLLGIGLLVAFFTKEVPYKIGIIGIVLFVCGVLSFGVYASIPYSINRERDAHGGDLVPNTVYITDDGYTVIYEKNLRTLAKNYPLKTTVRLDNEQTPLCSHTRETKPAYAIIFGFPHETETWFIRINKDTKIVRLAGSSTEELDYEH